MTDGSTTTSSESEDNSLSNIQQQPHHHRFRQTTTISDSNDDDEMDPNSPITLLVRYMIQDREVYCSLVKLEKQPETLQQLELVALKRWNEKCDNCKENGMTRKERFKHMQVRVIDRFNSQLVLDVDDYYFKDYTLFDNDLLIVHVDK